MELTRSMANRFKRTVQQFTHSPSRQSAFVERTVVWLNSLCLYGRSQPILSLTCLILFASLVLMLLIYRHRRRGRLIVERKRLEQETTAMRKQLRVTQSAQTESSTKGKVLIDYEDGGAGQTHGPSYGEQYRQDRQQVDQSNRQSQSRQTQERQSRQSQDRQPQDRPPQDRQSQQVDQSYRPDRQSQAGQRYAEGKRPGDVDQVGKQSAYPPVAYPPVAYPPAAYPPSDQRQNNLPTNQNHQTHQSHQIKQFEKNTSQLMNHGATAERPMNEGEPTYGTAAFERPKFDNKQQIEFNSRLKSAPKFDGHFCSKIGGDQTAEERRLKENYEQLADDGRQKVFGRQRIGEEGIRQRKADDFEGIRQRPTNEFEGIRQRTSDDFERIRQRTARSSKQTNQLDTWPCAGQSNDQSNQQTRAFEALDCGCCCCPSFCLARSLKLRREQTKRQLESEFCDCEFCADAEFVEQKESSNRRHHREDEECGSTSSFGSCDNRCKKKCRIVKLIRENVSSRSNSLGSLDSLEDHQQKRLFDHEYRRLVRKNRQQRTRRSSGDRADQCGANEDAIQRSYDSWSSHLHISSPCR